MAGRALATILALTCLAPIATAQEMVRVEGARFVAGGRPIHIVGANVAVMHGRDQREGMPATLREAAADGANTVRIWALGEQPEGAPDWERDYAFRIGEEGWLESSYEHLDRTIAQAQQLGLRVILVLANRWGDYGGITQYVRWSGTPVEGRTVAPLALGGMFFASAYCETSYRAHVARLLARTNTVTGARYAQDPTILAWELINEAEAAGASGERAMIEWVERNARFVREHGARQLVSAGHIGYSRLRDRALWQRVCALAEISYCDSHAYPLGDVRITSMLSLRRWIDDRVHLAQHVIGKPLLFGEVGVPADQRVAHGISRGRWLAAFYDRALRAGAAGALVWAYMPSTGPMRQYAIWVGDRDARTRDLRAVLRRANGHAVQNEPRDQVRFPGSPVPIFDPTVRLRGPATVASEWQDGSLRIDPRHFARAFFEWCGAWDGNPGPPHFYGAGAGAVTYRVRFPRDMQSQLVLRVLGSSELPGVGAGAGPEDGSVLIASIDGVEIGRVALPPDDGAGGFVEVRADTSAISSRGVHELELRATDEGGGGMCLYGTTPGGEPAGIELRFEPTSR